MTQRPYTRSLDAKDYGYLRPYNEPLVAFQRQMEAEGVPHRPWHPHRFWEYSSVLQQLDQLHVPYDARLVDLGSGGSFFPPYLASRVGYRNLAVTDTMMYGDITPDVVAQRHRYGIALPLYDVPMEDMRSRPEIGWNGEDGYWDVTMCISTIEHIEGKHDEALREMVRITKPGGLVFITSDYFRDHAQYEASPSRHLQFTAYTEDFVLRLPEIAGGLLEFVGPTDLGYRGDFVHTYSFVNVCMRRV